MKKHLVLFAAILSTCISHAQKRSNVSDMLEAYGKTHFEEKFFLHVNSNFFLTGESILFKGYCLNAADNSSSSLSKVAYVELIGPGATPVLQARIQLDEGTGYGDFFLPSSLISGNYTLIGYTTWMKNYSRALFFQTQVTVINPFKRPAIDAAANRKVEVKFYPEGGAMVAGVKNVIGFRGTRGNKALRFSGKVLDEGGQIVAEFNSSPTGVGKFFMTPMVGHEYKTVIMDSAQNVIFIPLPKAVAAGVAMEMTTSADGFQFILNSKALGTESMRLLIHQRSTPYYETEIRFANGFANVEVPGVNVPPGLSQVSILNSTNGVECTRLIWKVPANLDNLKVASRKSNYKLRENVSLQLSMQDTTVISNLSVSVRKVDTQLTKVPDVKSFAFGQRELLTTNEDLITAGDLRGYKPADSGDNQIFLPEVRGNLVTGTITDATGKPSPNQPIYLSVPSRSYQFYASRTDSTGRFFFNADGIPTGSNLVLTLNQASCPECKLTIDHSELQDYASFAPAPLSIDSAFKKLIEKRSVLSQIENAYYVQKQDSITDIATERFYGKPDKSYLLDDYVRFPTMEDVFIEYVTEIIVKKRGDKHEIKAMNFVTRQTFQGDPLILLDGVPMFDVEQVMNYNPLSLQKIEVVGRRYFYGPLDVEGIISLSTYEGDVHNISLPEKFKFMGMQPHKKYYSPNYRSSSLDKIPDYRVQLYWNPDVRVAKKAVNLDFFTSDIPGDYEIVAEGMQSDGTPVYHREVIHVEN